MYIFTCFEKILTGLPTTMGLTIQSILLALVGGILLSAGVMCRFRIVNIIFTILSSFLKGIPILVFLYMFSSAMDDIMETLSALLHFTYDLRNPPTFSFAVLAIALSYTPYMCDMIVTAMDTVPKGQWEACEAMGFTKWQTMTRIIIPQFIVIAIPNFGNHFVNVLKATSLACMVTIMEMMGVARNFATLNQNFLVTYTACALVYWAVFIIFEQLFRMLEKKMGRYLQPGISTIKRRRFPLKFRVAKQQEGTFVEEGR